MSNGASRQRLTEISDELNRTHKGADYEAVVSALGELDHNERLGLSDQAIRGWATQLADGEDIDMVGGDD